MPFSNEKKTQNFAEGLSPRNPIPRTPPHLVRQPENETTPMNAPPQWKCRLRLCSERMRCDDGFSESATAVTWRVRRVHCHSNNCSDKSDAWRVSVVITWVVNEAFDTKTDRSFAHPPRLFHNYVNWFSSLIAAQNDHRTNCDISISVCHVSYVLNVLFCFDILLLPPKRLCFIIRLSVSSSLCLSVSNCTVKLLTGSLWKFYKGCIFGLERCH